MAERLDAFMARANAAYYATHDPFADFTTAPEISQVFGEILGLWAAVAWQSMGFPTPVLLVEAGPGRGTLMADALRAIGQAVPAFRSALRVHFIETSPRLRAEQAARVGDAVWHDDLASVPTGPMILLANEFLDALPIRQFVRRGDAWMERYVSDGRFEERPTSFRLPSGVIPDGTIREINEPALTLIRTLASRFRFDMGSALFLDYGPEHSGDGDSLQALAGGKPADPLGSPGAADLTAHVDFAALAAVARDAGAAVHGPVAQGLFLAELGLFQRANRLARGLAPAAAAAAMDAARRLGEPNRMGRLFKVLAIGSGGCPPLPGFESR